MRKVTPYIYLLILFFSWLHSAHASFAITEIMYDVSGTDGGREWIEVENTGTSPDDLSKWYVFTDGTKHAISVYGATSPQVPAMSYAVVAQDPAKFKTDNPNFTGLLFDSSWTSLNNKGETIALKDHALNIFSQVSYNSGMGGAGDGYSLQNIANVWQGAFPTPGAENKASPKIAKQDTTNTSTSSTTSSTSKTSSTIPKHKNYKPSNYESSDKTINLDNIKENKSDGSDTSDGVMLWSAVAGAIIACATTVIVMRRKHSKSAGEDFKIME